MRDDTLVTVAEALNPHTTEQLLRERLAGRRMIFELGLDEDEFRRLRTLVFHLLRRLPAKDVRWRYPALLATYMTFAGTFLYEGGDYWSQLHPRLREPEVDAGRYFLGAVSDLGLESFDRIISEEKAHIWVSRILAQGGIPRSCLGPFAELVLREVDAGAADGAELLAAWRARDASLTQLHVPTRRFLLYGGDPAVDLVNRCIDLLREQARTSQTPPALEAGLPDYVLEAFASLGHRSVRQRRAVQPRDGLPQPQLRLDPYDGLGPVVVLPPVPPESLGGIWRVEAGEQLHRQEPSSYASETIRVPPAPVAETEFLTSDGGRRRWSFELLSAGATLFFDPASQALIRDTRAIALHEAWVLTPSTSRISAVGPTGEGPAREIQELPSPVGAWSGFRLHHLDLRGLRALRLEDDQGVPRTVAVVPPRARPALRGLLIDGVLADANAHVYAAVPWVEVPLAAPDEPLQWHVQVRGVHGTSSEALWPSAEGRLDLRSLLPEEPFGVYRLRVRGALGSDLSMRFAVVEGLEVRRPQEVVLPRSDAPEVVVRAPSVAVERSEPGVPQILELPHEDGTIALARLRHLSGRELDLAVSVPRLLWTIVHDTKPAVAAATRLVRVDAEEFRDHLADTLLVSVGRTDVDLTVELRDREGRTIQSLPSARTVGASGRWAFNLGPFASAIQEADSALSLHLLVGVRDVHAADIVSGAQVRSVIARVDGTNVHVRFSQHRPVRGRIARLWSNVRPWAAPVEADVPEGEDTVTLPIDERLPPGPYLAEVAVDDPWMEPSRPRASELSVRPVMVGEREEFVEWMRRLDPSNPATLVTWALGRYHGETTFSIERLAGVAGEVATSFRSLLADTALGQPSGTRFAALASIVSARDGVLVEVLARAAELDNAGLFLDRLQLRLIEHMDPTSDELEDHAMTTTWLTAPAIAVLLDLPWCELDERAADRCRLHLGWTREVAVVDPSGARVSQLELQAPAEQLRDLRFALGLHPAGLLHPETRMLSTFDWLLAQHDAKIRDDRSGPHEWFLRHRHLLALEGCVIPIAVSPAIDEHVAARTPPYGTESWAAVPALLLAAAVHHRWSPGGRHAGLAALEEALPWGWRLIRSDAALLTTLELTLDRP